MGWILAGITFLIAAFSGQAMNPDVLFIASGLFAIAGSISTVAVNVKPDKENKDDKENEIYDHNQSKES